ncbi:MAG TPA: winged helix-turn-helix domain-containing protein [Candidatus Nitrosotalea sp.]|nr:winged helix-turn-helix domain-containing protein [Candidatus Nitrosotalea sp.]
MSLYEFGPFQLDAARLLLLDRGTALPLGPKVVETLLALVEHPGELFPKNELLARIWPEGYVDEANLAQNVYVLRKTLRSRWNVEAIETIPRRGYRFIASVRRHDNVPRPEPVRAVPQVPRVPRRGAVLAAAFALALLGGSALTNGTAGGVRGSEIEAQNTRLYTIGRYYWNLRTRDGIAKSVQYFSRIVADDPRDARGYAGLALASAIMADYKYGASPAGAEMWRAQAYARQALVLDPKNSEAYAVLGFIEAGSMKEGKAHLGGLADLRHAIALDPANGTAHEWYGTALLQQGRVGEAYAELTVAAQLDPLSVATTAWLGMTAYYEHRYQDAIAYARETIDLSPQRPDAYETLGLAYQALGDQAAARRSLERLAEICVSCRAEAAALLAPIYARSNEIGLARAELAIARQRSKEVAAEDMAVAYDALGDHETALTWLRRARAQGDYTATEIANDPRFNALRRTAING